MIGKPKKKKVETSKLILYAVLIFGAAFLVAILIGWLVYDRTDAAGLAGVICAPVATVIGFYSWKAKHENIAKNNYKPFNGETEDTLND